MVSSRTQRLPRATARGPAPPQEERFASSCVRHPSCFALLGNGDLSSNGIHKEIMRKALLSISIVMFLIGVTDGQSGAPGQKFDESILDHDDPA